ncbi:sulfurtransferase [Methylocystis bryophila]|uniref:Sulfurtransferase n=1 Tax=Methylocystis bryophila TaxID=655015 RepID=A0A1W6MTV6_9HYPH|nr:rhodanese-like domain-containing protein [Methylocystis bryophila]ARN81040.1 3-mercaptopyruvate sulfurtransferase [Methylocystis bryophila]BDV36958.1 sulfurtransferase [Methylocystis bryophila]
MTERVPSALVSTEWLSAHLGEGDIRILDCTWHHPSTNLDGRNQYRGRHLPGSVHFDIDHIADTTSDLPHMLPNAADFAKKLGLLGVSDSDRVIVYDRLFGGSAAARAWWMFRVFGCDNVAMLDGGFGKWTGEKLPTEMSPVRPEPKTFTATFRPELVRTYEQMKTNLASGSEQVVDARGPGKFDGSQPDVFPFKKVGHIPNAVNVPWADLLHPEKGIFLDPEALAARFQAEGVDLDKPIVTTCASGITSCMNALALYLIGRTEVPVYDGAWAEWERLEDAPAAAA